MGATWQFKSQEHLDLFRADPQKFAPQYGGYCAWAVSRNRLVEIDPKAWAIADGKLYLNFSDKVQNDWESDREENIRLADENWPDLSADLE